MYLRDTIILTRRGSLIFNGRILQLSISKVSRLWPRRDHHRVAMAAWPAAEVKV